MALHPDIQSRMHFLRDQNLTEPERFQKFDAPATPYIDPEEVELTDLEIDGPNGKVPIRIYGQAALGSRGVPTLMWIHGGGFTEGGLWQVESDVVAKELASGLPIRVIAVDYRLCNDAVKLDKTMQDNLAVLDWIFTNKDNLFHTELVAVGGNSAGGAIAAFLALHSSENDKRQLCGVVLTSPVLHSRLPAINSDIAEKIASLPGIGLTKEGVEERVDYVTSGVGLSFLGIPFFAGDSEDLANFPPTLISNSDYDVLRASGEKFASQLALTSVDVTSLREKGTIHSHIGRPPHDFGPAKSTIAQIRNFLVQIFMLR